MSSICLFFKRIIWDCFFFKFLWVLLRRDFRLLVIFIRDWYFFFLFLIDWSFELKVFFNRVFFFWIFWNAIFLFIMFFSIFFNCRVSCFLFFRVFCWIFFIWCRSLLFLVFIFSMIFFWDKVWFWRVVNFCCNCNLLLFVSFSCCWYYCLVLIKEDMFVLVVRCLLLEFILVCIWVWIFIYSFVILFFRVCIVMFFVFVLFRIFFRRICSLVFFFWVSCKFVLMVFIFVSFFFRIFWVDIKDFFSIERLRCIFFIFDFNLIFFVLFVWLRCDFNFCFNVVIWDWSLFFSVKEFLVL